MTVTTVGSRCKTAQADGYFRLIAVFTLDKLNGYYRPEAVVQAPLARWCSRN